MKRIFTIAIVAASAYAFGPAALGFYERHLDKSPIVLGFSPGGDVVKFIEKYDEIRRSERPVVIDSICISACTMVAGLIPAERVCVTPYAKLAFHSASLASFFSNEHSPEGTRLLWRTYSEEVRELLRSKGWDGDPAGLYDEPPPAPKHKAMAKAKGKPVTNAHENLIYIEGDELRSIFKACD